MLHRIRALASMGHSVDLLTYPFGEDVNLPRLRILRCQRPAFVKDVRIGPSVAKVFLDRKLHALTRRMLRGNRYDVLHTHEEAAFFGARLARRHGLLHIYDMHSSLPQQLRNFRAYDLGLFRTIFRRWERRVLETADGVITICNDLARVARDDIRGAHHAMIENTGDDAAVFPDDGRDVRSELGLGDKCLVLYTGTFEAYQGIDLLLEAFAQVVPKRPRAHLVLVGGNQDQVETYAARAVQLGIDPSVTFAGSVHPARIPSFLRAADLIVSPRTRGTNTPLKIYAYLRSGIPLLATDMPTHTQTLTRETSLLVPPTAEGFAAGITRLVDDVDLRGRLAAGARAFARLHLSDEEYLRKVAAFYEGVLAAAGRF